MPYYLLFRDTVVIDHVVFEKVIDGKTIRLETKEDAGVQACLLTRNPFIANWQDIAIIDLEEYEVIERAPSVGHGLSFGRSVDLV